MINAYILPLMIFAAFGALCFNMGQRRANKLVLKGLLRGQIEFLSQRRAALAANQDALTREELSKAYYSYETIGQLVIGWYRYFRLVGEDKELRLLKGRIKQLLEEYLTAIEAAGEP